MGLFYLLFDLEAPWVVDIAVFVVKREKYRDEIAGENEKEFVIYIYVYAYILENGDTKNLEFDTVYKF